MIDHMVDIFKIHFNFWIIIRGILRQDRQVFSVQIGAHLEVHDEGRVAEVAGFVDHAGVAGADGGGGAGPHPGVVLADEGGAGVEQPVGPAEQEAPHPEHTVYSVRGEF